MFHVLLPLWTVTTKAVVCVTYGIKFVHFFQRPPILNGFYFTHDYVIKISYISENVAKNRKCYAVLSYAYLRD